MSQPASTPLLLNLGCGPDHREGFQNLDKLTGWEAESGLAFADRSVDGITISHMLMYLHARDWPAFFDELYRALAPGGVVRITEAHTMHSQSDVYLGLGTWWKIDRNWLTLTSPELVSGHLTRAGFVSYDVGPRETHYPDDSLMVDLHGPPPRVFFVEGVKPRHNA